MGAYVDVDGLSMYYEAVGEGEPVVLIHGTGGTADSWSAQAVLLADWYRVFMPECRGHGRTADVDGPYTHELFADDIAGFIEALGLGPVRVAGWSNGASVALRLALRRPELVSRVVLLSGGARSGGGPGGRAPYPEQPKARRTRHQRGAGFQHSAARQQSPASHQGRGRNAVEPSSRSGLVR